MVKILLAEDHNIVRNGIKVLLEAEKDFKVIGEAKNGHEVLELVKNSEKIDLILTDINMPTMDGIEMIRELKKLKPEIHVVVLSMLDGEKYITQAFQEGAAGYLLKSVNADEMVFAIKQVHSGYRYLCAEMSLKLLDKLMDSSKVTSTFTADNVELSPREMEVLNLISEGLTNAEMSEKLFLSKRTIEGHRQSLIEKTDSKNTAALIKYAVLNGIVQ